MHALILPSWKQHVIIIFCMQILASEVDFWSHMNEGKDLRFLHDMMMYPPRVAFQVDCTTADVFKLKFTFTGTPESPNLDREIMFPLNPVPLAPLQVLPLQAAAGNPYT